MVLYLITSVLAWLYMIAFLFFAFVMVFRTPPKGDGQFFAGNFITFMCLATSVVLFLNTQYLP